MVRMEMAQYYSSVRRCDDGVFPDREGFDRYGGYLYVKGTTTGRFHLETIDDRHVLITPEGHGYIALGVCHTGEFARSRESWGFLSSSPTR